MHAIAEQITERFLDGGTVQRRQGVEQRRYGRERQIHERRSGVIAAKVRTVEEQADERYAWTAVWCEGSKDACKGGTDKGEMLGWRNGATAARGRAKEERAVERHIHGRRTVQLWQRFEQWRNRQKLEIQ